MPLLGGSSLYIQQYNIIIYNNIMHYIVAAVAILLFVVTFCLCVFLYMWLR